MNLPHRIRSELVTGRHHPAGPPAFQGEPATCMERDLAVLAIDDAPDLAGLGEIALADLDGLGWNAHEPCSEWAPASASLGAEW